MKVQLLVLNEGPMKGKVVRLPVREFTIGREASCHLRPTSEAVAPRHCVIRVFGADLSVEDLGSPSGTLVNGQKIRGKVPLKVGDKITVKGDQARSGAPMLNARGRELEAIRTGGPKDYPIVLADGTPVLFDR